jgi:hypothetical protein
MSENKALPNLAAYLAHYWVEAGKVRSRHLSHYQIIPPIVGELANYAWWNSDRISVDFQLNHGMALFQIISRNRAEINRIAEQAKASDEAEDITHLLDRAKKLHGETEAATKLLRLISG